MKRIEDKEWERRLREEASLERPAFSMPLHEKVMGALRAEGLRTEEEKPDGRWKWRIALPAGLAAAAALGVWVLVHSGNRPADNTGRIVKDPVPAVPEIVEPVRAHLGSPAAEALEEGKYAYLDRDAERLVVFVARQIPTFPTGGAK